MGGAELCCGRQVIDAKRPLQPFIDIFGDAFDLPIAEARPPAAFIRTV
jgi:hypothetical protein